MIYVPGVGFIDLWLSLFISLLCAGVGAAIAVRKKRFPFGWALWGFFVPIISTIVLLILPPLPEKGTYPCPTCHEPIYKGAKVCKHCGSKIE